MKKNEAQERKNLKDEIGDDLFTSSDLVKKGLVSSEREAVIAIAEHLALGNIQYVGPDRSEFLKLQHRNGRSLTSQKTSFDPESREWTIRSEYEDGSTDVSILESMSVRGDGPESVQIRFEYDGERVAVVEERDSIGKETDVPLSGPFELLTIPDRYSHVLEEGSHDILIDDWFGELVSEEWIDRENANRFDTVGLQYVRSQFGESYEALQPEELVQILVENDGVDPIVAKVLTARLMSMLTDDDGNEARPELYRMGGALMLVANGGIEFSDELRYRCHKFFAGLDQVGWTLYGALFNDGRYLNVDTVKEQYDEMREKHEESTDPDPSDTGYFELPNVPRPAGTITRFAKLLADRPDSLTNSDSMRWYVQKICFELQALQKLSHEETLSALQQSSEALGRITETMDVIKLVVQTGLIEAENERSDEDDE